MARSLYADTNNSIEDICKTLGISRTTLYRHLGNTATNAAVPLPSNTSKRD